MMKKLVLYIGVLGLSSSVFAGLSRSEQAGKFNLSYENAPLASVLNDISAFSSQNFVFKKNDLRGVFVTLDAHNVSLKQSLKTLLLENNFEFENLGRGIMSVIPMPAKQTPLVEVAAEASEAEVPVALAEPVPEVLAVQAELSAMDKLVQCLEDPNVATTLARFQKRYVNWLKEEGFSTHQAVEVVRMASAAELLMHAQM